MQTARDITNEREAKLLAPYAMYSADSAGRRYPEAPHPYRGPYQRDRDRIIHSAAFRRLSYKTQVFTGELGDYHRTRLTHTLEMASIARTMARTLRLNEDLVEALALAHDIGHPPFGHSGEEVLDTCLSAHGGFNHNAQALRIFEVVESRYPDFPGLNLTREVLEGQTSRARKAAFPGTITPGDVTAAAATSPLLEVQIVDIADSIAYDAHDADDALEIGFLTLEELLEVPLWREANARVIGRRAQLNRRQLRRAIVHELIDWQVGDVLAVTQCELTDRKISSIADVRQAPTIAHHSAALGKQKLQLEQFLFERVYRHPQVLAKRRDVQRALEEMFAHLVKRPDRLPSKFRQLAGVDGAQRAVADYLAGMTDHFALEEHKRLVGGLSSSAISQSSP